MHDWHEVNTEEQSTQAPAELTPYPVLHWEHFKVVVLVQVWQFEIAVEHITHCPDVGSPIYGDVQVVLQSFRVIS